MQWIFLITQVLLFLSIWRWVYSIHVKPTPAWAFILFSAMRGLLYYFLLISNVPFGLPILIPINVGLLTLFYFKWGRKSFPGTFSFYFNRSQWAYAPLIAVLLMVFVKAMYWPVIEHDAVFGYDLLARYLYSEGQLMNVLFSKPSIAESCGPRLFYPPFLSIQGALYYAAGIPPKLFIVGVLWSFYSILANVFASFLGHFKAGLVLFFLALTPEWLSHGSLFLTNLPAAVFIGLVCIAAQKKFPFYVFVILMGAALLLRSDTVLLLPTILFVHFLHGDITGINWLVFWFKRIWVLLLFPLSWALFLKLNHLESAYFLEFPGINLEKMKRIVEIAFSLLTDESHFAFGFYIPLLTMLVSIKTKWKWVLVWVSAWVSYTFIYYFISDVDGTLFESPGGWMYSGYKRGLFSLLVLGWLFAFGTGNFALPFKRIFQKSKI